MDDNSIMAFGKHKGKKLANVPSNYLLWLYDNGNVYGALKEYIIDNMTVIKKEAEREKQQERNEVKSQSQRRMYY